MFHDRRTVLSALGLALPFGLAARAGSAAPTGPPPVLRFRPFEEAVREAFAVVPPDESFPCRRVEVGHADALQTGVQGCHNDRPFAGFPAGHLRIVRAGSEPGPAVGGVRLYASTVDVVLTDAGRPRFRRGPEDPARGTARPRARAVEAGGSPASLSRRGGAPPPLLPLLRPGPGACRARRRRPAGTSSRARRTRPR